MMKSKLFRDRQEARASDFNDMQDFTRASLDALVADAITEDARYKGLSVAQASGTEVTVGQGRLYDQGRIYSRDAQTTRDLIADLPVATKRYVTVVAYGQTVETSVEPRDFLIDLDAGTTEPQAVAMDEMRRCEIGFMSGSESVQPNPPTVPAGQVRVADVLLSPTGIVSVTMTSNSRMGGLDAANGEIAAIKSWRGVIGPSVDAIKANLSTVRNVLSTKASDAAVLGIQEEMARVRRLAGLPAGTSYYAYDDFRDATRTAPDGTFTDDAFRLDDRHLNFPDGGKKTEALDLFNAIDSAVDKNVNGLTLPSYQNRALLSVAPSGNDIALSSFTTEATSYETYTDYKTVTRTGTRKGAISRYSVTNASGETFVFDRDTYAISDGEWNEMVNHAIDAVERGVVTAKILDYETETYTYTETVPTQRRRAVQTTETFTGMTLAQTLLSPRLMWLTSIGLNLTQIAGSGDITVLVTGVAANGRPNQRDVKTRSTVSQADLNTNRETVVSLAPALIEAGEQIAVILVTQGSHRHASGGDDATEVLQGAIFYRDASGWQQQITDNGLAIKIYGARFPRPRTEVRLQDISLTGGIRDLKVETEQYAPAGTRVTYEYQVDGVWRPLADGAELVSQAPSTVPLRAVFAGTTEMQPAIMLGANRVEATVSDTAMVHYSGLRQLPAPSSEVTVELSYAYFDSAVETITVELLDADNANTVIAAAGDAVADEASHDPGSSLVLRKHRWTFTPTGLQNYYIKISGTTSATTPRPFAVIERVDSAA